MGGRRGEQPPRPPIRSRGASTLAETVALNSSGCGGRRAQTTGRLLASAGRAVRLTPSRVRWSAACQSGAFEAYSAEQRRRPPTRSRWPGCAGGSGVVLELLQLASATRSTASMMSTPTRNLQVCRHPCTSALRENARLPHTAVPWQVLGSLKTVFHESIPSIY